MFATLAGHPGHLSFSLRAPRAPLTRGVFVRGWRGRLDGMAGVRTLAVCKQRENARLQHTSVCRMDGMARDAAVNYFFIERVLQIDKQ